MIIERIVNYNTDENCYIESSKWIVYGGKDYYLLSDGKMATNCYVLSADKKTLYKIAADGTWNSSLDITSLPSNDNVYASK